MNLKKRLKEANQLLLVQSRSGCWDCESYTLGMFNGMELIMCILEDREPNYKTEPEKWLRKTRK